MAKSRSKKRESKKRRPQSKPQPQPPKPQRQRSQSRPPQPSKQRTIPDLRAVALKSWAFFSWSWRKLAAVVTVAVTAVGFTAALVTFIPSVAVKASDSLDPTNPLWTPFIVTNDGILPLTDVEFTCAQLKLKGVKSLLLSQFRSTKTNTSSSLVPGWIRSHPSTWYRCAHRPKHRFAANRQRHIPV